MNTANRHFISFLMLIILSACVLPGGGGGISETPVSALAAQTPLASPTVISPPTLTVCMGNEPTDLLIYNEPTYEKSAVLEAIYDGPIDRVDYAYQPVILEKLPSLADGDAVIETVQVQEGQTVVDESGNLSGLVPGVIVRPAGCRSSGCAKAFTGGSFAMERMSVTFHMKPGLVWSDGTPLTAADSVFSYRVSIAPEVLYGNGGLVSGSVQSVTLTQEYVAIDDNTTRWTGLPGFFDPNYQANFFIPLPQNQLVGYQIDQLLNSNEALRLPLGWGAYRITAWEPGQQILMERNPYYFRAGEGLPSFERLVFRFVGQDAAKNLSDLQTGQCDLLLADTFPSDPTQILPDWTASTTVKVYAFGGAWEQLTFGIAPADDRPAFFADARTRRAIASCINRQALADEFYPGLTSVPDTFLPLNHPLETGAQVTSIPYDPAAGIALLDQIGWRDLDGDQIREADGVTGIPDGTELHLTLRTTDMPLRGEVGTRIAADLKVCGVDVSVSQTAVRDLLAKDPDSVVYGRHFDLAEFSWVPRWLPSCADFMTTSIPSADNGWGGPNVSGYSNPAFDAACRLAQDSLPGMPEYVMAHQEALRIFSEDLPALPLFVRVLVSAARPDLTGILTDASHGNELRNIEAFKLEP